MDESRLFPLLVIILIWLVRTASKNKKKAANRTQTRKPSEAYSDTASAARAPAGRTVSEVTSGLDARMAKEFPHLFRNSQPSAPVSGSLQARSAEGRDPCHDDYASMPSGSLHAESAEGRDPCHDGYASMSSGSLQVKSAEGTDPCHDGWEPPAAAGDNTAKTGAGLNLSWAGSDIVKGFIYGEILNRKVG